MTNMEIVNRAESIVNDPEHIDHLSADDITMLSAALGIARIILREQEAKVVDFDQVKPLTLDELREMDGEPVWIRAKHYGIYADIVNIMGKEDGERRVHFSINYRLQENGCGKTWLAYRHKP